MDAVLISVASAADDMIKATFKMKKDDMTVDPFDYINKTLDIRVPDEKEA